MCFDLKHLRCCLNLMQCLDILIGKHTRFKKTKKQTNTFTGMIQWGLKSNYS